MTPIVGLTMARIAERRDALTSTYMEAVQMAGGIPVLLPNMVSQDALNAVDGLILTGGGDFHPKWYGEPNRGTRMETVSVERDATEMTLIREAGRRGIPMLGICRGIQALAVTLGGTLIQDLASPIAHSQSAPRPEPTHTVEIDPASHLFTVLGLLKTVRVNSFHHQAVADVPPGWQVSARSEDGMIEAMEGQIGGTWSLGVQWHPEDMVQTGEGSALKIFQGLIETATCYHVQGRRN